MLKFFVAVGAIFLTFLSAVADSSIFNMEPIIIKTSVRGHGNVRAILTHERNFGIDTTAKFYQGYYVRRGQDIPVAATYNQGVYKLTFAGKITGSSGKRQRHFTVVVNDQFQQIKSFGIPSSALGEQTCATHEKNHSTHSMTTLDANQDVLRISISTYADVEWYNKFGTNSNTEILSLINSSEALYYRQLRIRFKVVSQDVLTTGLNELDPIVLLRQFSKDERTFTDANVKFLFTGKDLTTSTIGIAYVGSICYAPEYSYGVVQSYSSLTANVFAHELGHILSASHDTSDYGNIMYPSISMGDPYFTSNSLNQINIMLSAYGQCIERVAPQPESVPGILSIYRVGSAVAGVVYTKTYQPVLNQEVALVINNTTKIVKTNKDGKFKQRLTGRRGKSVTVTATVGSLRKRIKFKM